MVLFLKVQTLIAKKKKKEIRNLFPSFYYLLMIPRSRAYHITDHFSNNISFIHS